MSSFCRLSVPQSVRDGTNTRTPYFSGKDTTNLNSGLSAGFNVEGPITRPSPPRMTKSGKIPTQSSARLARGNVKPYSTKLANALAITPAFVSPDRIPEAPSLLLKQTLIANGQRTIYSPNAHLSENEWSPLAWPSPILGQGPAYHGSTASSYQSTKFDWEAAVTAYDEAKRAGHFECKVGDDLTAKLTALLNLRETFETLLDPGKAKRAQAAVNATLAGFVDSGGKVTDPLVGDANFCIQVAESTIGTIDSAIGRVVVIANDSSEADECILSQAIAAGWVNEEWVRDPEPSSPGDA